MPAKKSTQPAPAAKKAVEAPAPTPVVAAPAPAPVVAAAPVASPAPVSSKSGISPARIRRHLDKLNLNRAIEEELAKLKVDTVAHDTAKANLAKGTKTVTEEYTEEVSKTGADGVVTKENIKKTREVEVALTEADKKQMNATVAALAPKMPELEGKIAALSRERVRFSNNAPLALSVVCDELIQQLIEHAMKRVVAAKKKIVQVGHLHEDGVESLSLFPLVRSLPSFVAMKEKLFSAMHKEEIDKLVASTRDAALKEFKKLYADGLKKKKLEVPAVAASAEEPAAAPAPTDDDDSDSKTTFRFYVVQVCKEVIKANAEFAQVRISTDIRNYLSDLVVELIQRLSGLVYLTTVSMNVKTVNDEAILRTVQGLMIDGKKSTEKVSFRTEQVVDPEALKAEQEKKAAAKKEGKEYKINTDALPKVVGYVAEHSVEYVDSGFSQLAAKVKARLTEPAQE